MLDKIVGSRKFSFVAPGTEQSYLKPKALDIDEGTQTFIHMHSKKLAWNGNSISILVHDLLFLSIKKLQLLKKLQLH